MSSAPTHKFHRGPRPGLLPAALAAAMAMAGCATGGSGRNPGPGEQSLEWAGLRFDVEIVSSPTDRLRVRSSVTNAEDRFLVREIPFCIALLRLYRGGRVVWDQGDRSCFGRRVVRLRPSESRHYWTTVLARDVLADGVEPGSFLVRAYWPAEHHPDMPPRSELEVTVGEIRLERP